MSPSEQVVQQKTPPSLKKSLTIATAIMVGSVFLSRIIGMVREMVMAAYNGTSNEMDAYVVSFLIPELLNHFLAGGFLSVTFIPIFQKYIVKDDREGAWRTFSNLLTTGTVLFVIALPLAMIFTPEFLSFIFRKKVGVSQETVLLAVRLTRIILPAQLFFYWGAFLMAVQYANNRYLFPALSPLCYNAGIILGGIVLSPWLGIEGFAWGVLIGAFLGNVVLQLPGALRVGMRYRPFCKPLDAEFLNYVKKTLPLVLGLGMVFSNEIFFRFFGARLDEGATASVNYALRTMLAVVAVFGQASGVAFFPYLSRMAAEKAYEKMASMLNSMLVNIALYLIPLSALMIVLSPQIIAVLFERKNFTAESTAQVAPVLSLYLAGAFAYSASLILSRSFYALQNTVLPMVVSTVVAVLSIPLYILMSEKLGAQGIALAASLGMFVQFVIMYLLWGRKMGGYASLKDGTWKFLKILGATSVGVIVCFSLQKTLSGFVFSDTALVQSMIIGTMCTLPSLGGIFLLYDLLGLQKIRQSIAGLSRRRKTT